MAGITVMEGNLEDFPLADVLGVLGLSRQYTRLELLYRDGKPAGSVFLKSGKVVQAVCGASVGRGAFLRLFAEPAAQFRVVRVEMPALIPEPIDSVAALLIDAATQEDDAAPETTRVEDVALDDIREEPGDEDAFELRSVHPAFRSLAQDERDAQDRATPVAPFPSFANLHGEGTARSGMRPVAPDAARIIAVASPKGGAGKTTVALNLALSLTRRGLDVILVDGDINGDVMSSFNARDTGDIGVFDVLSGKANVADALRGTAVPNLRVIPALGAVFPSASLTIDDHEAEWRRLLADAGRRAQIVIVDTPAGMFGTTHQILKGCTHVIGVLQADVIAQRSFTNFSRGLSAIHEDSRPTVLGIALNMLAPDQAASVDVLTTACDDLPSRTLFDTIVPRSNAFQSAAKQGVPVLLSSGDDPPAVSFLFDTLAGEVIERLAETTSALESERVEQSLG